MFNSIKESDQLKRYVKQGRAMPTVRYAPRIYHYEHKDWKNLKQEYEDVVENIDNSSELFGCDHNDERIESNKEILLEGYNSKHANDVDKNRKEHCTLPIDVKNGTVDNFTENIKTDFKKPFLNFNTFNKITKSNLIIIPDDDIALIQIQKNDKVQDYSYTPLSEGVIEVQKKEYPGRNEKNNNHSTEKRKKYENRIGKNKTDRSKWRIHSRMLATLVVLNLTGQSAAVEVISSSTLASLLGYPSTCTLGAEVRPCTLSLTCWLRGGTRVRGCGGWLFSCCQPPTWDTVDNNIISSDWTYKVTPPRLRQVPQRNVMPNNAFRRRVDDDVTQYDCGVPSSRLLQKRIIGGREARFAEFPWQAHVRISEFQCGGVLVSRRYVATAAHCVSRAHIRDISVWLGALDTSAGSQTARKVGVIQKILHPLFQFRMTQPDRYDIALLKLSRPITFTRHIRAICLPENEIELWGRVAVIAGWGKTDATDTHTGTNMLRSATVPILSKEQCIAWHQSKQILVEIHSEMLCAGHSDGHQDACLGDSGGPLIVLDNGRYYLVGITSAGFGCGVDHQPGIYHNVQVTANWIRALISPNVRFNDV